MCDGPTGSNQGAYAPHKRATHVHCFKKNDTDVAHYNFNAHQPTLVIFGGDIAERICY